MNKLSPIKIRDLISALKKKLFLNIEKKNKEKTNEWS